MSDVTLTTVKENVPYYESFIKESNNHVKSLTENQNKEQEEMEETQNSQVLFRGVKIKELGNDDTSDNEEIEKRKEQSEEIYIKEFEGREQHKRGQDEMEQSNIEKYERWGEGTEVEIIKFKETTAKTKDSERQHEQVKEKVDELVTLEDAKRMNKDAEETLKRSCKLEKEAEEYKKKSEEHSRKMEREVESFLKSLKSKKN